MNKNTILAFLLILGTVLFFNSRFYYEQVRKMPYPFDAPGRQHTEEKDSVFAEIESDFDKTDRSINKQDEWLTTVEQKRQVPEEPTQTLLSEAVDADTIWIETEKIIIGIHEVGAKIVSVRMREYHYRPGVIHEGKDSTIELLPRMHGGGMGLTVDKYSLDTLRFTTDAAKHKHVSGRDTVTVRFSTVWEQRIVEKIFTISGTGYVIGVEIHAMHIAGRNVGVSWQSGIAESEWTNDGRTIQTDPRKVHVFDGKDVEHFHLKKTTREERSGTYKWVGITSKYFLIAMMSEESGPADIAMQSFADTLTRALPKSANNNYAIAMTRTAGEASSHYRIYAGPMQLHLLRAEENGLQRVLYRGWAWFFFADKWFPALCELMLRILLVLGHVFRDYGIAIVLLTVVVKLITYPLVQSSMKSMGKMRDLQPKINAIRSRHKSDAKKMNEELMELYRKEGVNPFNPGCLPMFLQMPILFSLYVVLRKAIELRGAATVLIPWVKDLSQEEVLWRMPFTIPWYGDNFALMPIIMGIVTFVQNKKTMKDPNQAAMVYFMPVMMLVLFNKFPAGLVMYWTLSSGIGLAQQVWVERKKKQNTNELPATPSPIPVKSGKKKRKNR